MNHYIYVNEVKTKIPAENENFDSVLKINRIHLIFLSLLKILVQEQKFQI